MDGAINYIQDLYQVNRRDDLPSLNSGTTTKTTATTNTDTAKTTDNTTTDKTTNTDNTTEKTTTDTDNTTTKTSSSSSKTSTSSTDGTSSGTTSMPSVGSASKSGSSMPKLTTSSETYTTPSITVPANNDNPFIIRTSNANGTVFIAVGAIVGAILLGFILYHLILSIASSKVAKKSIENDKKLYEKYQYNNNNAYGYGMTPQTTNDVYSVAKLPLLTKTGLGGGLGYQDSTINGDNSTIYQSEFAGSTSKPDLTKMFISPTAEVMQHKRTRSNFNGSVSNFSMVGSQTNVNPSPQHQHSQIPNLYINNDHNNSDFNIQANANPQARANANPRKTIPSMYLDDLVGNKREE